MKISIYQSSFIGLLFAIICCFPSEMQAQRMNHGASRGGGRMQHATRPSHAQPSHQNRSTRNRSTNRSQQTRPSTNNKSINGGHHKSTNRKTTTGTKQPNKSVTSNRGTNQNRSKTTNRNKTTNKNKSTNRNNKANAGNKANIGNKTHIGNNNINVNINNRNTVVRASPVRYTRPPYRYGGFSFYCHRPYYYHPYRPFYWGPYYHPWGYFVTTLATTAIIVSITNDKNEKEEYNYENGTYYKKTEDGFVAVQAPVGAEVPDIPKESEKVKVGETTNNYYYGGAFYEKSAEGYTVVPAVAGTIVPGIPDGGEEVKVGDQTYVKFGETYYQPIQVDGKDMYEIIEVKEE